VDEVDVEAVDLRDEVRHGFQPRLEPPEVVLGAPVTDQLLHRHQRHTLRLALDGLLLGPARRRDAPAQFAELLFRNVDVERPNLGRGLDVVHGGLHGVGILGPLACRGAIRPGAESISPASSLGITLSG
jgi:hypothetical protein